MIGGLGTRLVSHMIHEGRHPATRLDHGVDGGGYFILGLR